MFSLKESFTDLLNKYRREGESHSSFGRRMGFSHKVFQEWQRGSTPKIDSLKKIREKLGLTKDEYDELFYSVYNCTVNDVVKNDNTGHYDIIQHIVYARSLSDNYLLKRLVAFKDGNEDEREFARRLGIPDEVWEEGLKTPYPGNFSAELLFKVIHTLDPHGRRNVANALSRDIVPSRMDGKRTSTFKTYKKKAS